LNWLAYFGAPLPRLKATAVDGDYKKGAQLITQTQGLIKDQPRVQQIFAVIHQEAGKIHQENAQRLNNYI